MKDHRLEKGIEEIRNVGMTAAEKKAVLGQIFSSGAVWNDVYSLRVWLSYHRAVSISLAVLIIIALGGGGTALAAEGSVPGDILYPIKVNVTEPLRQAMAPTSEAKARLAADFTVQRVREAEQLAESGQLDAPKQAELSGLINEQTQALDVTLNAVAAVDPSTATHISKDFKDRMREQAQRLDRLTGRKRGGSGGSGNSEADYSRATGSPTAVPGLPQDAVDSNMHPIRTSEAIRTESTALVSTSSAQTASSSEPILNDPAKEISSQALRSGESIGSHDWNNTMPVSKHPDLIDPNDGKPQSQMDANEKNQKAAAGDSISHIPVLDKIGEIHGEDR